MRPRDLPADPPVTTLDKPTVQPKSAVLDERTEAAEPRNFVVMMLFQVVMRTGWIFKTESIIMPAVLDTLGGGALLRGCLPLLNRIGQSVPPLLAARRVKIMPRKKWALVATTSLMACSFLALALLWLLTDNGRSGGAWLPILFLLLYAVFFAATGVLNLCINTLQGKLIQTTHRGRLMLAANLVGAATAIGCAAWLLPRWLRPGVTEFGWVFAFAGGCFGLAAICALLFSEVPDRFQQARTGLVAVFGASWRILAADRNFRRLAVAAAAFGTSIMLFPHYQALGLGSRLGLQQTDLIVWVIVQNAGTALFSFMAGPLADWRGNRLVLQLLLFALCGAWLLAIGLSHQGAIGAWLFPLVFLLVGLTPVTFKVFNNYTLEIARPDDHPRHLSTLSLCIAAPIFCSPLVGWLVGTVGFDVVFITIATCLFGGWLMTFTLAEPRHDSSG